MGNITSSSKKTYRSNLPVSPNNIPPQWTMGERQAFLKAWDKQHSSDGSSHPLACLQPSTTQNTEDLTILCIDKDDKIIINSKSYYPIPKINWNYVKAPLDNIKSSFGSSGSSFFMIFMIISAIIVFYMLKIKGMIKF